MTTRNELFQRIWKRYEREHDQLPASAREVVEWAVEKNLLNLPETDPHDILAGQMATRYEKSMRQMQRAAGIA